MTVDKWYVEKESNESCKAQGGAISSNKTKLQTDDLIIVNMDNQQ